MMEFLDIDEAKREGQWYMADLHSHPHYELYFLLEGERDLFLPNRLYRAIAPCILVIPPYELHKTEGGSYLRINVNVSDDYLDAYQRQVLESFCGSVIPMPSSETLSPILYEMLGINKYSTHGPAKRHALFSYLIYRMDRIRESTDAQMEATAEGNGEQSVIALKTLSYLNENFTERITLDDLSEMLYVSKPTILSHFRRYTGCTVGNYLLNLRLAHAKELLANTKMNMSEISEACGFSSPNYFGIIFRRKENISPLGYRKYQKTKN